MDVFDAVRTLLAVRRYQDRSVPEDVIRRVLEAGRLSASARNRQPWHFVVVQDRDALRHLGTLVPSGPYIAQAPLAIVVAIDRTRLAVADASRAIQSMLLTAWAEGVGGNWSGFGPLEGIGALLGIPADDVGRGKKNRKPLDQIAHRERWGRPFA